MSITPKKAKPPRKEASMTLSGTKKLVAYEFESLRSCVQDMLDANRTYVDGRMGEIINMLPRFRELVAEQETAKLQMSVADDRRFSKIIEVEIAKLDPIFKSIRDEQYRLSIWIERVEKRKKKK